MVGALNRIRENFIRSAYRIPPGEALRPSWRGGGRAQLWGLGGEFQGVKGWEQISAGNPPQGSWAGRWPGRRTRVQQGLTNVTWRKGRRKLKGQNYQCPLDRPETLLRKENEEEGKGALFPPSFLRGG